MNVTTSNNGAQTLESAAEAPAEAAGDELREQAISSLKRKRKFADDVLAFLAVNGVLWLIWAITDRSTDGSIPWPAWVSIVWGFLLAIDAWRAYGRWAGGMRRPITEEEIHREIERSLKP